jgi:SAM-dependent methyltransferase
MTSTAHADILTAYDGVEELSSFSTQELAEYRAGLLERTAAQTAFITARLPAGAAALEVGSGNGRLLIDLARRGAIARGVGLEVAESRVAFAQEWAASSDLDTVRFLCADALTQPYEPADAALCITGTFAYFDAIQPGGGGTVLAKLRQALPPGGLLVLEVYPHPSWRRLLEDTDDGTLRLWHELPPEDPWRFYLSELHLARESQILTHRKTFIHRTTGEIDDSRCEHLRLYDGPSVTTALAEAGCGDVDLFGDWTGKPHEPSDELLIAVARAQG